MANNVIRSMAVTYVQSNGEHVSANIFGPSCHEDKCIHLKYMRNGKEIEHNAAFDKVLFSFAAPRHPHLRAPPHVCCHVCRANARPCLSTGWALNRRFDQTFGTAAVLAQAGGG